MGDAPKAMALLLLMASAAAEDGQELVGVFKGHSYGPGARL